jgi:hypothetical protein
MVMAVASFSLTLCLFLMVADSWIGGYALILPFVGQLFISSLIGTIATIQVHIFINFENKGLKYF